MKEDSESSKGAELNLLEFTISSKDKFCVKTLF